MSNLSRRWQRIETPLVLGAAAAWAVGHMVSIAHLAQSAQALTAFYRAHPWFPMAHGALSTFLLLWGFYAVFVRDRRTCYQRANRIWVEGGWEKCPRCNHDLYQEHAVAKDGDRHLVCCPICHYTDWRTFS